VEGRRYRVGCITLLLLALPAGPARADRLAVLEFSGKALAEDGLAYLTGRVRAEAVQHLPDWEIITRDNMLVLLDASKGQCLREGECEVETGRHLGADLVVAGEVVRFAGRLRLTLNAYDTRSGRLLRSAEASGSDEHGLVDGLPEACRRLFSGSGEAPPEAKPAPPPAPRRRPKARPRPRRQPAPRRALPPPSPPPPPRTGADDPALAWTFVGVGAVSVLAGGVNGVLAARTVEEARGSPHPAAEAAELLDTGRRQAIVADVALAVGTAVLALGIWLVTSGGGS